LMKVVNPSSQDRMPRRAIVLPVSAAAAPYRASGLVLWPKAGVRRYSYPALVDVCVVHARSGPSSAAAWETGLPMRFDGYRNY
jgi:hypothetical protein